MKHVALLVTRLTLAAYLGAHAVQKLTGSLGGPGLDRAGRMFERMGLQPGKPMAALAGGTELTGAVLTAAGALDPIGPLAIAGAMTVAAAGHRDKGPFVKDDGFELPAAYAAAALALAATGPGRFRVGPRLWAPLRVLAWVGAAGAAGSMIARMTQDHLTAPTASARDESALYESGGAISSS